MAALSTNIWEFRATAGSANAGGGFDTAASGTDFSNQDSAQLQLTDLATSGIGVTTLTSATGGFTASMIGNYIQIRSGTNVTAGFYRVTAHTDTNTVTLDRAPDDGVGGISGGAGDLGGALDVLTDAFVDDTNIITAGITIHIKNDGTMTLTGNVGGAVVGTNDLPITIDGYNTTRGDNPVGGDRPIIAAGANFFLFDQLAYILKNLDISGTPGVLFRLGTNGIFQNCKCQNTSGTANRDAFSVQGDGCRLIGCEAISDSGQALDAKERMHIIGCYIHDSADGINMTSLSKVVGCIIETNTNGITGANAVEVFVVNCTFYNNTTAINETTGTGWSVVNNIFKDNTDGAIWTTEKLGNFWDNNCWDNTTDVTLVTKGDNSVTSDPLLNDPANGDFTLKTGSPCLDAGLQVGTDQGAVGDYKVNIGADQDDVTAVSGAGGQMIGGDSGFCL